MKIKALLQTLNHHVPFNSAESWDNVGLLIGNSENEVHGILTALDCTIDVVNEAINQQCNTIIAHHPLIFKGVKSIVENEGYGAILYALIKNNINLIALHTNLDVHPQGVNAMLAERIGIKTPALLNVNSKTYFKVQVFIPKEAGERFKNALSEAGIAKEGNYEYAFFNSTGIGQFKPTGDANPTIGRLHQLENVEELKIEFMIETHQRSLTEHLIKKYHPYETPVYDFIPLEKNINQGLGVIGQLNQSYTVSTFVTHLKTVLNMPSIRYIGDKNTLIENVAIIGGSGIGFESMAQQKGADVFITGDIKHHEALDAKIAGINLIDINHYSEYVMKEGLVKLLSHWLMSEGTFKILASTVNTDPYTYY
ncbi:Nif3-like dinuclear metal center hexameric protein [Staphylococcus hyicus]|uniref:Nif3-like dinuclear metal center hexameric protein n=1 Tax=Staphylococcus hyicus TaxID=1284 RepID=UPI00217E0367|nr:Nif3-like dinuclear metal center hexameric protein [Staphylococcus hyicus]UWF55667.1 Nif3-like dinuclear metal center hexameric protein [Staphylococcus hyicus]